MLKITLWDRYFNTIQKKAVQTLRSYGFGYGNTPVLLFQIPSYIV